VSAAEALEAAVPGEEVLGEEVPGADPDDDWPIAGAAARAKIRVIEKRNRRQERMGVGCIVNLRRVFVANAEPKTIPGASC